MESLGFNGHRQDPTPSQLPWYGAYGRYYGNGPEGQRKYLLPIDAEELDRLDMLHKFFLVVRNDTLCAYDFNLVRRARVLDLGAGTGIWAIELCQQLQQKIHEVVTVDINPILPYWIPPKLIPVKFDIEKPSWTGLGPPFDLAHVRTLRGSIADSCWKTVYRNIIEHLKPGKGYFEQVEIDWYPEWDKYSRVPENSALRQWADELHASLDKCGRSARIEPTTIRTWIRDAGFVDIEEKTIKCYWSPWSADEREREAARWLNVCLSQTMEALGLMPMIEQSGKSAEDVRDLCSQAEKETRRLRNRGYFKMYIWTARRPSDAGQANESQQVVGTEAINASRWGLARAPPPLCAARR